MSKEIIENIKFLRGLIEAYPQELFDLDTFTDTNSCGTLYCSVGLAASHPHFQAKGISLDSYGSLIIDDSSVWAVGGQRKLDAIFGEDSFAKLFSPRNDGDLDKLHPETEVEIDDMYGDEYYTLDKSVSDKQLGLWRIDQVLNELQEQV